MSPQSIVIVVPGALAPVSVAVVPVKIGAGNIRINFNFGVLTQPSALSEVLSFLTTKLIWYIPTPG